MNRAVLITISSLIFICISCYFISFSYTRLDEVSIIIRMWGSVYIGTVIYILYGSKLLKKIRGNDKTRDAAIHSYVLAVMSYTFVPAIILLFGIEALIMTIVMMVIGIIAITIFTIVSKKQVALH